MTTIVRALGQVIQRCGLALLHGIDYGWLCFLRGVLQGVVLAPLLYILLSVGGLPGRINAAQLLACAQIVYVLLIGCGVVTGMATFIALQVVRCFLRVTTSVRTQHLSAVACRVAFVWSLCGACAGYFTPVQLLGFLPMSVAGLFLFWGLGLVLGTLWGGLSRERPTSRLPSLDALLRWAWAEPKFRVSTLT